MSKDPFVRQYIETALWSSTDDSDAGEPLDSNYGAEDLDHETLARFEADCQAFREQAGDMLSEHDDITDAAHDFWLTRNGHGCGFWDGDWPINGEALTTIARKFGECHLYVGGDDRIHVL